MDNQVHNSIVGFIWGIADDCLRDVYVRGKYRDVILPMTVIRRLDAILEETKPAVLKMKKQLDAVVFHDEKPREIPKVVADFFAGKSDAEAERYIALCQSAEKLKNGE